MDVIAVAAAAKITACRHQEIGNIAWAYATLAVRNEPLFDAIADETVRTTAQFNVQGLANTLWAFAKLSIVHKQLIDAVSAAALATMTIWDPQALANLAWSHATF